MPNKQNSLKYYLWILGCQHNYADAERIASVLNSLGYKPGTEQECDIFVTVACSVKQKAVARIYGKGRELKRSRKNKNITTILSGCVLESDKKALSKIFDVIFEIENLSNLPRLLKSVKEKSQLQEKNLTPKELFAINPTHTSGFQALVPISQGCNNFCSYCVVPYTRGREVSRKFSDIINEVKTLVEKGFKEITLIGQNVDSYGNDLKEKDLFLKLLKEINKIHGDFWVRYSSSHPKDISKELINSLPSLEKVTPWIHLPVQSGSNKILKAMNRKYVIDDYLKTISALRSSYATKAPQDKQFPALAITTDIIVGFPGETREDFEQTIELFNKAKFDMAFISQYSPRAGTVAAKMKDNVTQAEKKARFKELTSVLGKIAKENNNKMVGKNHKVLVEKFDAKKGLLFGHTDNFKNINFKGNKKLVGTFAQVKVTCSYAWGLSGELS